MPRLKRPDGAEIWWDSRGEGPPVILSNQYAGAPGIFEGLLSDLAGDHRVIVYHLRGTGRSDRRGPYDMETDVADLEAVIEDASAQGAVAVGMADGCDRAVKLAARRPDLLRAVVVPNGNPLGRAGVEGTEGLAGSASVLEAVVEQTANDYRGAVRMFVTSLNPQMTADEIREAVEERVAFATHESTIARLKAWIDDDSSGEALALEDRLWLIAYPGNPWFGDKVAERTRHHLPDAHVDEVEDGPVSRPDITSATVRKITASIDEPARTA